MGSAKRVLAASAVAGQLLVTVAWIIGGATEGRGYSPVDHNLSDLAARTAAHPWPMLITQGLAGATATAFALLVLRPALGGPAPWLVAASAPALDNVSDAFFRLECRVADPGCTNGAATASASGVIHYAVGAITFGLTMVAAFVLARRYGAVAFGFGCVLVVAFVIYAALTGEPGMGLAQRVFVLLTSAGLVLLALPFTRRTT
ncbi:hypothetical protein Val02_17440 [Virgisporangium aliadipatigenens]|uniref:DUF998 domain-containing protein n=1 Tax=Virgisporangium aliadipatigenens TaxID=741659 RepID=A0A8J3YJ48_9ACTN|nr:DUF998 domain-containing protein [Virgisporangium aliadipatigenens]GIJ44858.1 hypothetical protein Val02_17440 [Virgisporangium aliadipatigenens]